MPLLWRPTSHSGSKQRSVFSRILGDFISDDCMVFDLRNEICVICVSILSDDKEQLRQFRVSSAQAIQRFSLAATKTWRNTGLTSCSRESCSVNNISSVLLYFSLIVIRLSNVHFSNHQCSFCCSHCQKNTAWRGSIALVKNSSGQECQLCRSSYNE